MYMNPSMGYNPSQRPYQQGYQEPYQQETNGLISVIGLDGAKAYKMSANSTVALFDGDEDLFYIKSTDGAGFPTIRTFKFEEIKNDKPQPNNDYVSRKEMEEYVKQFIQQANPAYKGNGAINAIGKQSDPGESRSNIQSNVQGKS